LLIYHITLLISSGPRIGYWHTANETQHGRERHDHLEHDGERREELGTGSCTCQHDDAVGMRVEVLGDGVQSFLALGECPLHQRLDVLAPFAGRHHLVEFERDLGRDGEGGSQGHYENLVLYYT